jgi:hypothetical protein
MTRGRASSPTGLDSWSGRAVSEHVADCLGDGINRGTSEVADRLAPEGTRLLTEVRKRTGRQMPHLCAAPERRSRRGPVAVSADHLRHEPGEDAGRRRQGLNGKARALDHPNPAAGRPATAQRRCLPLAGQRAHEFPLSAAAG